MKLTLGFSLCPNDTFIFDAMVNGKIDTKGLTFEYVLEDVETLNRWADMGKLDITKISYNAFLHTVDKYVLLHSGSALGKGVGPILVSNKPMGLNDLTGKRIAIPGYNTTANLLLSLACPNLTNKQEVLFSEIEQAVLNGAFDAGLIIHESRFTYKQKGLTKIIDLGDWWEHEMKTTIPLGGIVVKRNYNKELCKVVDTVLKESIQYAWKHYPLLTSFVTEHSQEMEESVMRQHIELYVNDYTTDLGYEGEKAIETLFNNAYNAGLIDKQYTMNNIFY